VSVGERLIRVGVNLDDESVGAGCDGSAGHGGDVAAHADAVAGIHDDGQGVRDFKTGTASGLACCGSWFRMCECLARHSATW